MILSLSVGIAIHRPSSSAQSSTAFVELRFRDQSAFWSSDGASHLLLRELLAGTWTAVIDNHLITEYDEVLKRHAEDLALTFPEIDRALDGLCALAEKWSLGAGWIPVLADPDDEPVLQLAVEAQVPYIATRNERHFRAAETFGIQVISPGRFLHLIRSQS